MIYLLPKKVCLTNNNNIFDFLRGGILIYLHPYTSISIHTLFNTLQKILDEWKYFVFSFLVSCIKSDRYINIPMIVLKLIFSLYIFLHNGSFIAFIHSCMHSI